MMFTVMLIAIGLVGILAWKALSPISIKNGFNRHFKSTFSLTLLAIEKKNDEITDIAGATKSHLFFKTKNPEKILMTDYTLKIEKYFSLNVSNIKNIATAFQCSVDSPLVYIMANNMPGIAIGQLDQDSKEFVFHKSPFTRIARIATNRYILRGFDSTSKDDQIFIKRDLETGVISREPNIIERRHDAGISTDGFLSYDTLTHLLIYSFVYKNKFLCLDTNLQLKNYYHTIDTISTYQATANLTSNDIITNTTPSRVINGRSSTEKGKFFNISKLKADNEIENKFETSVVIDIYDILTGRYESSFYIPDYDKQKMIHFKVINDKIIIVYPHHFAVFAITK